MKLTIHPNLMLRIRMTAAVKAVPLLHSQGQLQLDIFIKNIDVMKE
jgi:hypothetical protein